MVRELKVAQAVRAVLQDIGLMLLQRNRIALGDNGILLDNCCIFANDPLIDGNGIGNGESVQVLPVDLSQPTKFLGQEVLRIGQIIVLLFPYFGGEGVDPIEVGFMNVSWIAERVLGAGRERM